MDSRDPNVTLTGPTGVTSSKTRFYIFFPRLEVSPVRVQRGI